jgi:hypothetical protein
MSATPYVQIFGLDFTDIMDGEDSMQATGGGRKTDEYSLPGWKRAYTSDAGREAKTWSGEVHSPTLQDIKDFLEEVNRAPADSEFYFMDSDLCYYASLASGGFRKPSPYLGHTLNWYHADFEVVSNEPFAFAARQGLTYDEDVALPAVSASLTNSGTEVNTIDYLAASGSYSPTLGYTDNLKLTVNDYELELCSQLMGHDLFELSRWGEISHTYSLNFARPYETLQSDLWGSAFVYGGAQDADSLTITNGSLMFPFAGPLPVSESPAPELDVHIESGTWEVYQAFAGDLSDIALIDIDVVKGHNIISIPDCDGQSFISFGLKGSGVITDCKATVKRYLAESELPEIEVDDTFTINVSDGSYSNHMLESLIAVYRDKYWF